MNQNSILIIITITIMRINKTRRKAVTREAEAGLEAEGSPRGGNVDALHILADKLSARNLALIREKTHLGRNSFRLCGFRRASPTIETAILDINTCCHTIWACQPNNRYNRIKRRFSRRTRELRRVDRIFGPTGRIRNRA